MKNSLISIVLLFPNFVFAEVVDKVVAIVNSEAVLQSDLINLQKNIKKPGAVDENIMMGRPVESLKDNEAALNYLVLEKIIESEVKRLGYGVTVERAEQEFKTVAKRAGLSEAELEQALKSQGVEVADYKKFLKTKVEKQSLLDSEIISKLRVSDEEAASEYEKRNPGKKISTKEYTLSHIFFSPKKAGGAEAALERAKGAREKLLAGVNFEKLAKQLSEDPNFEEGGRLGTFKSGDFMPEIEAAISEMSAGQTTGLVRSKIGYHIVKINRINIIADPKFAKERERIREGLMSQAFERQFQTWLKGKKEDAFIHINK